MEILKTKGKGSRSRYTIKCKCGNVYDINRQSYLYKQRTGATHCKECSVSGKYVVYPEYEQAIADMEFVNRHWKPV
jgi:hypothetical protein